MKIGEEVHLSTTTSPSFNKIEIKTKVLLYNNSTFYEFLIHLFLNSLIFANSLLDDPAHIPIICFCTSIRMWHFNI